MVNYNSEKYFQLPGGHRLCYAEYGIDSDAVLFYFHGLPGCRLEAGMLDETAKLQGVRVIAIDRPGFGRSDNYATRRIIDWPEDINFLADHLNIPHFNVVGVSGGGPFALACAALISDRISSVGIVCGLGPVHRSVLLEQMPVYPRYALSLANIAPSLMGLFYSLPLKVATGLHPKGILKMIARTLGDPDRTVLMEPAINQILAETLREVFRTDMSCAVKEAALHHQHWGFELSDIQKKIHLWHGDQDNLVPLSHSVAVKNELQDADLNIVAGEGHFSLPVRHAGEIIAALME